MNFESLIFDIDGTLLDSRQVVAEGYNVQLRSEGLERYLVSKESLTPLFGKTLDEIAVRLFPDFQKEAAVRTAARCIETSKSYFAADPRSGAYPGLKETMEALAGKYRLFIVSNCEKGYPEICMKKLGITDLIEGHLCFGNTGTKKGDTILRLMKEHHIQSAAYIGDTQGDLEAARDAGIPFIWSAYGFGSPAEWEWKIEQASDLLNM